MNAPSKPTTPDVFVISLDEAKRAFRHWTKRVWDDAGEPVIIHPDDADRAAEAFLGSVQAIRTTASPKLVP